MHTPAPPDFRQKTLLLAQQLEAMLREQGAMPAEEACLRLLQARRIPRPLAAAILRELVAGDRRFRVDTDGSVALAARPAAASPRLREVRFTVLDLETTGGSPAEDRILEVGAVRVEAGRLCESFATLVNPGVPVPSLITSMTGIQEEMILGAPQFRAVGEDLARFIGDSVLVAHNLPFDLGFLNRELSRNLGFVLANPSLCTVRLGRRLLPNLPDRRLDTLADYYGFSFVQRHRALGDATVTAMLLLRFIALLEEQGVEDLAGAERFLCAGSGAAPEVRISDSRPPRRRPPPPTSSGGS
jgi:DNA polymerase III subunit epsilon